MIENFRKIPNQLTAIRFVAVPGMWIFAILGARLYVGLGFIVGMITDLLHGLIARKYNQTSDFGSKFDSMADHFLQISSVGWILMQMPEIFRENIAVSFTGHGTYTTSLTVGLAKFKRIANLHLYLSKAGELILYVFFIHAFIVGQYSQVLFMTAGLFLILSSAETLILQLTSTEVYAHIGVLLLRYIGGDHPLLYSLSRLPYVIPGIRLASRVPWSAGF